MIGQSNERVSDDVERCGARLARARKDAGITIEDVSARLKMPVRVVRALENDEWQSNATVFVRGHLRSYAQLLGVDIEQELAEAGFNKVQPVELVSHTHTPKHRRILEQAARRGIYIAITAVIVVPVWLATRPHLSGMPEVQSLDVPGFSTSAVDPISKPTVPSRERTPVIASMAAIRAPVASHDAPGLSLSFTDDSWLQVTGPDGEVLEEALLSKGEKRQLSPREGLQIVIGNIGAIEASQDGKSVDLAAFSRANVARFRLSSDGSLAPTSD